MPSDRRPPIISTLIKFHRFISKNQRHLLFSSNHLRYMHTKWEEEGCNDDDKWLNNIKVIHMHIIAEHIIVAGDIC